MREHYDFDTTPSEEPCQQVGPNYNPTAARKEARRTIDQIVSLFGQPPEGSALKIASNPHDFGSYLSIRFIYDDESEDHSNYLNKIDDNWPKEYDS
jgi:hypothetical protein